MQYGDAWELKADIVAVFKDYVTGFMRKHGILTYTNALRFAKWRDQGGNTPDKLLDQFLSKTMDWQKLMVPNNHFELVPLQGLRDNRTGGARDFFRGLDKL